MKKIGIVTLYGSYNYGNRLQNYAVQELLRKEGYLSETLVCKKSRIKEVLRDFYYRLRVITNDNVAKRHLSLKKFNKQNIYTNVVYRKNGLLPTEIANKYDAFCVGSDQVWNPEIRKKERWNFFLQFAKSYQRICISPSVGVSSISSKYREEFSKYLSTFKYLSCREAEGTNEISVLSGKRCEHIIDPTLAMTQEEWRKFETKLDIKKKYIVIFVLGILNDSIKNKIKDYANKEEYEIIELSDISNPYYSISPKEFVWLIDKAELVFTDSFHAAAFSINLNTSFYVFDRQQNEEIANHLSSRIRSLVSLFGLEDRYIESEIENFLIECDFYKANQILIQERNKFNKYLKKCLKDALEEME